MEEQHTCIIIQTMEEVLFINIQWDSFYLTWLQLKNLKNQRTWQYNTNKRGCCCIVYWMYGIKISSLTNSYIWMVFNDPHWNLLYPVGPHSYIWLDRQRESDCINNSNDLVTIVTNWLPWQRMINDSLMMMIRMMIQVLNNIR